MNNNCEDHSLTLGLGFPSSPTIKTNNPNNNNTDHHQVMTMFSGGRNEPSLTLSLSGEAMNCEKKLVMDEAPCSVVSAAASSLSNVVVSVKRERETASSDELEIERGGISSRISDEDEDGSCPITATRKKLRLTKDQSAMLEESFKQQSTLNPKQKQALADRLGLRPRQVEVWFQNRRARTKLKQTEVDCEYLKKCCETLTDENRRLQKELQELKNLKLAQPFYMHLPAATLTMCPSCERIGAGVPNLAGAPAAAATVVNKNPFSMGPKTHHFYAASPNRPLLVDN